MLEILNEIWFWLQHPLVILIWMHFIADFVFQSNKVAIAKSKCNKTLLLHVIIYSVPFIWFGGLFALINGIAHFITDYFTSRATSWLYQKEERHWFFVVVGFDQAIHLTTLFVTYMILIGL